MEEIISGMIEQYGPQIWLTFVTFVITGFALTIMKDLVADIVYYFRARMSDIGYGQRIYWKGEIYVVQGMTFKHILIKDDKKVIRIPIKSYMNGPIEFPLHRYDDFDEKKYHQPPWDGKTERRGEL